MNAPVYRQRFYLDAKLQKSTRPRDLESLRKLLDTIQRDWSRHVCAPDKCQHGCSIPPMRAYEFDPNNAHSVTRVSADELNVTTTGGRKLRWVNVEVRNA